MVSRLCVLGGKSALISLALAIFLLISIGAATYSYVLNFVPFYSKDYRGQELIQEEMDEECLTLSSIYLGEDSLIAIDISNYGDNDIRIEAVWVNGLRYGFSPTDLQIEPGEVKTLTLEAATPVVGQLIISTFQGNLYKEFYRLS